MSTPMIKELATKDRPREKLINTGAANLSDAELMAIFLRTGIKGTDVMTLALQMLNHFGSIKGILDASLSDFNQMKGLGLAKYAQLQAAGELVKRAINEQWHESQSFTDPAHVNDYLLNNFECCEYERFACLLLNSKHRLLRFDYLFNGGINSAQVYPRVVAQHCLRYNAAAIIFAHNHPSGDVQPSQADRDLTVRLVKTLQLIDVKVLDHFIIGHQQTFSMASHQMI